MPLGDWIRTLADKLPLIQHWIEDTLVAYHSQTTPVAELGLPHLGRYFPQKLLRETKTVHLSDLLPLPPLSEIGLDEFSSSEEPATYEAVTYGDTIFLREAHRSEVLYFHELVHVLQWERLGIKHYLFAYIAGLLEFGYHRLSSERRWIRSPRGSDAKRSARFFAGPARRTLACSGL